MTAVLECKDIIQIYPNPSKNETYATLRGISFNMLKGEFITIIGPSGVGKSTFLNILTGNLQPSAGSVKVCGTSIYSLMINEIIDFRVRNFGIFFQNPRRNVIWNLSVLDNVQLPMTFGSKVKTNEIYSRALDLLEDVNLKMKANEKLNRLSGGELQKLGLAIARANNPPIYILDEPTSQLDRRNSRSIIKDLKSLCLEEEASVLMVTHDSYFASTSTKSFLMENGKLVQN